MGKQYIINISVKENTYNLYYSKYNEIKRQNPGATHDDLLKALLGLGLQ
jgi:hypothetical protein